MAVLDPDAGAFVGLPATVLDNAGVSFAVVRIASVPDPLVTADHAV